jgi:hypothetical protein
VSREIVQVVVIRDDITGAELRPEEAAERTIALGRRLVRLDLGRKTAGDLDEVMRPWLEAGEKIPWGEPATVPGGIQILGIIQVNRIIRAWAAERPEWDGKIRQKSGGNWQIPRACLRAFYTAHPDVVPPATHKKILEKGAR